MITTKQIVFITAETLKNKGITPTDFTIAYWSGLDPKHISLDLTEWKKLQKCKDIRDSNEASKEEKMLSDLYAKLNQFEEILERAINQINQL